MRREPLEIDGCYDVAVLGRRLLAPDDLIDADRYWISQKVPVTVWGGDLPAATKVVRYLCEQVQQSGWVPVRQSLWIRTGEDQWSEVYPALLVVDNTDTGRWIDNKGQLNGIPNSYL